MKIVAILLTGISMLTKSPAGPAEPVPPSIILSEAFRLVKQQDQISLYERWIEMQRGEKVRELKAVFEVIAREEQFVGLLRNAASGKKWNTNAKEYSILESGSPDNWITYIKYGIPWPMDDQDVCLQYRYRKSSSSLAPGEISFESIVHPRFPSSADVTRITGTKGSWVLEKQTGSKLLVTYLVRTDRNKKVPRWIADPIIHNSIFKTMSGLRDLLQN